MVVGQYFWVVRRGSPETDSFIMRHEYFPNKELCATKMMVHIKKEGPEEDLLYLERNSLDSSVASSLVPPEEGVDRFRDKEDEDNPLTILSSGSLGFTVTESDISTLRREWVSVEDDNEPAPENIMHSDDVLPTPSSLTFVFHGVDPWRQSGNFPVGRTKLKMTPNPRIQHISRLYLFTKL